MEEKVPKDIQESAKIKSEHAQVFTQNNNSNIEYPVNLNEHDWNK